MAASINHDQKLWIPHKLGNEEAYSQLFRRHHSSLVNYGKSLASHHILVQDCAQVLFIEVWLYRSNLNIPSSVKAYLLFGVRKTIARKLERAHIFRHGNELQDMDCEVTFTVLDEIITDEETRNQVGMLNRFINEHAPILLIKY